MYDLITSHVELRVCNIHNHRTLLSSKNDKGTNKNINRIISKINYISGNEEQNSLIFENGVPVQHSGRITLCIRKHTMLVPISLKRRLRFQVEFEGLF